MPDRTKGIACLLIRKHDHFTPAREIKRHVRALARNHSEGWKLQEPCGTSVPSWTKSWNHLLGPSVNAWNILEHSISARPQSAHSRAGICLYFEFAQVLLDASETRTGAVSRVWSNLEHSVCGRVQSAHSCRCCWTHPRREEEQFRARRRSAPAPRESRSRRLGW